MTFPTDTLPVEYGTLRVAHLVPSNDNKFRESLRLSIFRENILRRSTQIPVSVDKMVVSTRQLETEPTRRTFELSTIDQIAPKSYMQFALYFALPLAYDKHEIFGALEASLHTTQLEFPRIAAHIQNARASSRGEMECHVDERPSIDFFFQDWTTDSETSRWSQGTYPDLRNKNFPVNIQSWPEIMPPLPPSGQNSEPCFIAQANFLHGGLILAVRCHHVVMDGTGMAIVFKAWAKHSSTIFSGREPVALPALSENAERRRLSHGEADVQLQDFPDWKPACNAQVAAGAEPSPIDSTPITPEFSFRIFHITSHRLSRLRKDLRIGDKPASTSEALCAMLWKHVSRARHIDRGSYPSATLSITVDTRARLSPALSPRYTGCASEPNATVRMSPRDICWAEPAVLARNIRKAVSIVDNKAVRRLVGLLNQMPNARSLTWNVDRWPGPDMLIVNIVAAGWCEIDWGGDLGCAEASRALVSEVTAQTPDGRCIVNAWTKDRKGIDVLLNYEPVVLQRLARDAEFTEMFRPC